MIIHIVKSGETINSIAAEYGVSAEILARNNDTGLQDFLVPGQTLVVLYPETVHNVAERDSLDSIAGRYGVSVNHLWRNNIWLGGRSNLRPGQQIVIDYSDKPQRRKNIMGYAYTFVSYSSLREALPYADVFSPFSYGITVEGDLIPPGDEPFTALAREYGVDPYMHISTLDADGHFSSENAHAILNDPLAQETLIDNIADTAVYKSYKGVDVDFEFIPGSDADLYASFLDSLRRRLNPLGLQLMAAVAPKTSREQTGLLYEGHDYAAIGEAVNKVLVMTYEWGYTYGPPMAVAPIPNVRAVLNYAVTDIPSNKIYMGMPNYGYDWPLPFVQGTTRATSIGNQEALTIAAKYNAEIQYDEYAQSPFFNYRDERGIEHEVWFEDARSVAAKCALIDEYNLFGAGYWNFMRRFPQNWLVVNATFIVGR